MFLQHHTFGVLEGKGIFLQGHVPAQRARNCQDQAVWCPSRCAEQSTASLTRPAPPRAPDQRPRRRPDITLSGVLLEEAPAASAPLRSSLSRTRFEPRASSLVAEWRRGDEPEIEEAAAAANWSRLAGCGSRAPGRGRGGDGGEGGRRLYLSLNP